MEQPGEIAKPNLPALARPRSLEAWRTKHPIGWAVLMGLVLGVVWSWTEWTGRGPAAGFRGTVLVGALAGAQEFVRIRPQPPTALTLIGFGVGAIAMVPWVLTTGDRSSLAFPFVAAVALLLYGVWLNRRWERRHGQQLPWHRTQVASGNAPKME